MRAKPCIGLELILEKGGRTPLFVFFLNWNKSLFEKIRNGQNVTPINLLLVLLGENIVSHYKIPKLYEYFNQ